LSQTIFVDEKHRPKGRCFLYISKVIMDFRVHMYYNQDQVIDWSLMDQKSIKSCRWQDIKRALSGRMTGRCLNKDSLFSE